MGGEARRGKLSANFVELVSPRSDCSIVTEDGNKDWYFSRLSKEKQIPLMVIKDTQELGALAEKNLRGEVIWPSIPASCLVHR